MSRIDAITGKGAKSANSRSHSNIATRRRQHVNLQTVRINGRRVRVAASTLRTLRKLAKQAHGELPTKRQKKAAKKEAMATSKKQ
ncbi:50S ribosomal protein L28 [Candidatus Uhrbacteria bacterium]|nr:MAG: 50S ribosomal protein L28 [Candidatus Uhrbacteria bacterium]